MINLFNEQDGYPIPRIDSIVNELANYNFFWHHMILKYAYHQIPLKESYKYFTAFEAGDELYEFN